MKCPYCRSTDNEVYNTRSTKFATQTWRRRRCLACHEAFTTYEAPDLGFLMVARAGAKPERYSRARLFSSLYSVFLDIPDRDATIDAVTDTIESKLLDLQKKQLSTQEVATIVLSTLKHFNTTAFVRYLTAHATLTTSAQLKKALGQY